MARSGTRIGAGGDAGRASGGTGACGAAGETSGSTADGAAGAVWTASGWTAGGVGTAAGILACPSSDAEIIRTDGYASSGGNSVCGSRSGARSRAGRSAPDEPSLTAGGRTDMSCRDTARQDATVEAAARDALPAEAAAAAPVTAGLAVSGAAAARVTGTSTAGATVSWASAVAVAASCAAAWACWARLAALRSFLDRVPGGCRCQTRTDTRISSFSVSGAIRTQVRGSET